MAFTKEQAKATSILDVAHSLGMEMKRSSGQEYYWTQHDSFKINTRKNRFSWYSRDIHGDVINLVETIKGVSFKEAMHFLETGNFPEFVLDTTPKAPFEYRLGDYEEDFVEARDYLKNQRGLSDETIDFFEQQGVLAQARYRNQEDGHIEPVVVFKYFDQDKQLVGASLQGIVPDQERHKGKGYLKKILFNSDGLAGLSVDIGQPNRLVFTEAPIDLMSYYELHKDSLENVRLVSMDGVKEELVSRYFMEIFALRIGDLDYRPDLTKVGTALETAAKTSDFFDEPENESLITLAVDNDNAGNKFIEKLADKGIKFVSDQPPLIQEGQKKMDWNEYLKQEKGVVALEKGTHHEDLKEKENQPLALEDNSRLAQAKRKLERLENELVQATQAVFAHQAQTNGQPMNDKRGNAAFFKRREQLEDKAIALTREIEAQKERIEDLEWKEERKERGFNRKGSGLDMSVANIPRIREEIERFYRGESFYTRATIKSYEKKLIELEAMAAQQETVIISPGAQYLIDQKLVNQWAKQPSFYFVQGQKGLALQLQEDGTFALGTKYLPKTPEQVAKVEELLALAKAQEKQMDEHMEQVPEVSLVDGSEVGENQVEVDREKLTQLLRTMERYDPAGVLDPIAYGSPLQEQIGVAAYDNLLSGSYLDTIRFVFDYTHRHFDFPSFDDYYSYSDNNLDYYKQFEQQVKQFPTKQVIDKLTEEGVLIDLSHEERSLETIQETTDTTLEELYQSDFFADKPFVVEWLTDWSADVDEVRQVMTFLEGLEPDTTDWITPVQYYLSEIRAATYKKSLEETQGITAETTIGDLPGNQEAAPLPEATISQPLNGLSPNQTQSQPLLQFTIKGLTPSTYKPSYHPITEKELRKLNRYAPNLQQVASWYLENLADSQLTYFYSDGKETGQVTVEFGKEHFMHLTGLLPQKEGQTAEQTLLDFVQGSGDFDHLLIANSGGAFDKLQVLPELQEVVESDAFYFNDLSSIEKLHRLDLDQAIRTADKDLLLALRAVDGTALPASVMKLRSGLNAQLDQAPSEKVILGVYQERDGQITQLSINETYIKDGGQEMMAVMQDKYRQSERKQYDDVQVARQLDSDGDGISNEDEIRLGTDPHNANSRPGKERDGQGERIDMATVSALIASNDTKGLSEHLRQGMRQYLNSDQYKTFLTAMSKFHNYSPQNIALILAQNPDATVVASYRKWQNDFGRQVQKGERGLKIRVPMTFTLKDDNGQPKLDEKGQEIVVTRFKLGTVFDVSQTQGKPLPRPIYNLENNVLDYENLYRATRHVSEQNGVPISFETIGLPNANGYFDRENRCIVLADKKMSEAQIMKSLFHEMAHSVLLENAPKILNDADYALGELQAESVAYIVASHYGIDTSEYSFGYLAGWARNDEGFERFEAQLKIVQETAKSLINRIDNALVLVKNKTLTQDKFQAKLNQAQAKQDSLLMTKEGQEQDLKKPLDTSKTLS